MTGWSFADPYDVSSTWAGWVEDQHAAACPGVLATASDRLRLLARLAGAGDLDERHAADELVAAQVRLAVINATIRALRNPDGLRQFQRTSTTGPFTDTTGGTYADAGEGVEGLIRFTSDDLLGIIPTDDTRRGFVGTARLRAGLG